MDKKCTRVLFFLAAVFFTADGFAQNDSVQKAPVYKIGIFAPLYLDSVFSKNTFRYKQGIPRFIMPAVDFVQGALLALDSLQAGEDHINATIYDTKSYKEKTADLIRQGKLDSLQLIVGSVRDEEYVQLANFARQKNIPFISATYPNVGSISGNPFLVIMNSTLKAHCEAIYSYLLQNHGTDKIYLCRQKGAQEDMVASWFRQMNEQDGKPLLPITIINLDDNLNTGFLRSKLDSNSKNIIIGGSLDETFAGSIAKVCYELNETYSIKLIGMPNWDNFTALYNRKELSGFPIYFTTPYYNDKSNAFSKSLAAAYNKKYKGKPSDMAYKGYEAVYLFTKLLTLNPDNFMSHINDKTTKIFCEYNFRPVSVKNDALVPDYFENKHVYLIKILNGSISKAW